MYDILFKPASANDPGTMCSNMNVSNNINAKTKKVLDNFNYCKDYVEVETDAFIVAAAMNHFGMESLEQDDVIPHNIHHSQKEAKRLWLHKEVEAIVEKLIMNKQAAELEEIISGMAVANPPPQCQAFPCRGCGKAYNYRKCRENHEMRFHPDLMPSREDEFHSPELHEPEKEDHVFNYACVRLSLGMFLRNFNDAVQEGDGERIIRCWKFLLLIYKSLNHHKYALASLHLIAKVNATLTPQKAHSLVWNRTVNNRGGAGKNISLDLRMEHIVHLHKEMLSNLGVNLTPEAALRCSKAVRPVEELLRTVDHELCCQRPSGKHTVSRSQKDFESLVHELHVTGQVFLNKPDKNREYQSFPGFKRTVLGKFDYAQLNSWVNRHIKDPCLNVDTEMLHVNRIIK